MIHEILQEHSALSERVSHQVVLVSVTQGIRDVQSVKTFLELNCYWNPDYTPDKKTLKHIDASDKDILGEGGTFEGGLKTILELQVEPHRSFQSWKDMSPKHVVLVCEQMKKTVLHSSIVRKRLLPKCTTCAFQGFVAAVHGTLHWVRSVDAS